MMKVSFPRGLILPLLFVTLWQVASSYSPWSAYLQPMLSAPSAIVVDAWKLTISGDLIVHIANSLVRVLGGFIIAVIVAVPVGLLIGVYSLADDLLDPVLEFLRPIPPPAWIPLGILWFGIGNAQNMFIIFLGAFFPIALNTIAGVRATDPLLIAAARTLGASRNQVLTQIVLPASVPPTISTVTAVSPINLANQHAVTLTGTGEAAAKVVVTVTDSANAHVTSAQVTATGGNWTVSNLDLSSLKDGQLTFVARVTDTAGNFLDSASEVADKHTVVIDTITTPLNNANKAAVEVKGTGQVGAKVTVKGLPIVVVERRHQSARAAVDGTLDATERTVRKMLGRRRNAPRRAR
jgi:ABC-type nitrate/sulfonate/bicarbonate transport system permease component/ribosome-associated translation inhibitor RaiA